MVDSLPANVLAWQRQGMLRRVGDLDLFVVDTAPGGARRAVLLLHGFPSSGHDWHAVLPALAGRRLVIPDLPGFGLSEKPADYGYSLFEQADCIEILLRDLGIDGIDLIGHDMGTSVATELCARRERGLLGVRLESLLLMNGSVHIELARLTPAQKLLRSPLAGLFARLASAPVFRAQLRRILARPIGRDELDAMWALIRHRDGHLRMRQTIGYVSERFRYRRRWLGALRRLDIPTRILWGPDDPVAVAEIARRLAADIPGARLEWLPGLGHYPQLEDPAATGAALRAFLDAHGG
ncbi:MAG TPA: hypothetical protein DDZ76_08035 [Xanthomonadales bacterium]|nr:hypothetical protein [Xanthomonadales bacterium]